MVRRIGSKEMLINFLEESEDLFKRLQDVTTTTQLKEKFGNSILNLQKSIKIIDKELSRDEIKLLVKQIRQNIKDDKH